jgi:hypothetical protein
LKIIGSILASKIRENIDENELNFHGGRNIVEKVDEESISTRFVKRGIEREMNELGLDLKSSEESKRTRFVGWPRVNELEKVAGMPRIG